MIYISPSSIKPDSVEIINGVTVNKYLIKDHNVNHIDLPSLRTKDFRGVTIHNTEDLPNIDDDGRNYTASTCNGNMKTTRVHYYVDDKSAWQNLEWDSQNWSCADGKGDGNSTTIAIECIMSGQTGEENLKARDNTARLAAHILYKHKKTIDNLYTHTHWLNVRDGIGKGKSVDYLNTLPHRYKTCPIFLIPKWSEFKALVQKYLDELNGKTTSIPTTTPKTLYRVRKSWKDAKSQIGAFSILANAKNACKEGYSVFDDKGNRLYTCGKTTQKVTTDNTPKITKPNVTYRTYSNGKWRSEITNYNTTNDMGYSGVKNLPIRGLVIKVDKGVIKYRVHKRGGNWLGWITAYNINDWNKGVAGIKTADIDGIQIEFSGISGYDVRYRVSTVGSNSYLSWVIGTKDYAGIFGKNIDQVQIEIVETN